MADRHLTHEINPGGDYTPEELEFLKAIDAHKRRAGRVFLAWSEVLAVLKSLGYAKAKEDQACN